MTPLDLRAQLEHDLTWRLDELRHLRNLLTYEEKEDLRRELRKAIIVMLYAHFEGFCKVAFQSYVSAVNALSRPRRDVNKHLRASAMAGTFRAYDNRDRKNKVFKNDLPDDTKLHRYSRQVDFLEELDEFLDAVTAIDPDLVVDTKSNLEPVVLRTILFRLGLAPDSFSSRDGAIRRLLGWRNAVAHGDRKNGFTKAELSDVWDVAVAVMREALQLVFEAFRDGAHLQPAPGP